MLFITINALTCNEMNKLSHICVCFFMTSVMYIFLMKILIVSSIKRIIDLQ